MNLNMIKSLKSTFHLPTGFSDHAVSHSLPAVAVALGACIIEKHITLNKKSKGPDHHFSLEPSELKIMVKVLEAEISLGAKIKQPVITDEKKGLARRIVLRNNLNKNEKIKREHIIIKRVKNKAIHPRDISKIIGLSIKRI